jgi:hypothetical protein
MNKTSLLIKSQLPSFIRDDDNYQNFVAFLEAYYEWMEKEKGVLFETNKLLEYSDIDITIEEYVDYFYNEFLPAFPTDVLTDKRKLVRFSKGIYEAKGNIASYRFLFRVLYNADPEIVETKEFVLKASAGKWFLPRSVKLKTNDSTWINTAGLWIFGNDSKALAKIERAKIVGDSISVFISDIERLFNTGEFVRVVDEYLNDVKFENSNVVETGGNTLEAKLLGTISNIIINPNNRGNYYQSGDPVIAFGGLDDIENGIGAEAEVQEVTLGSIQRVRVENGSWGYRETPNTFIFVTPDSGRPIITVAGVNPANTINVTVVQDSLELKKNIVLNCNVETGLALSGANSYCFYKTNTSSIISNANTVMSSAFTYTTFPTYSIDTVNVENGGGGFGGVPSLRAESVYQTDLPFDFGSSYDPRYFSGNIYDVTSLKLLGILGPILFMSNSSGHLQTGNYYQVGDEILFTGGIGGGAYANVTSIVGDQQYGPINAISYYTSSTYPAPFGGFGYTTNELPSISILPRPKIGNTKNGSTILTITSDDPLSNICIGKTVTGNTIPPETYVFDIDTVNNTITLTNAATANSNGDIYYFSGNGAQLYVSTVLGDSARLVPITDRIGSITSVKVTNYGEDYVESPSISLKVQDIAVNGISLEHLPKRGDILYQGDSYQSADYISQIDSITRITFTSDPLLSTFVIRTYNYTKLPNVLSPLVLYKPNVTETQNTFPIFVDTSYTYPERLSNQSNQGVLTYGDGTAKANSQFLNGLVLGQGRYLDESHQPSSFSLLQNENYNNFTYLISVEKEISKYKDIIYKIVHPAGTKVIGQTVLKSEKPAEISFQESTYTDHIDDFEFIWAAIATEEDEENEYNSELIRFSESNTKYGIVSSNNSNVITIKTFPNNIFVNQQIFGNEIPTGTKISNIYLNNNTILLSRTSTSTKNNVEFLIKDQWTGNSVNYVSPFVKITGNTVNGSNLLSVATLSDTVSNIFRNQIVVGNTLSIFANTTNNSNLLENVQSVDGIVIGHYVSGNNIPHGTRVADIDAVNNTITLTNTIYANANGISYKYYDKNSGNYIDQYKYNYIKFSGLPYNTKVIEVVPTNNAIILSENYIKSNFDDVFYFIGDGSSRESDVISRFVRVESGSLVERDGTEPLTPAKDKYFTYNDYVDAYDINETVQQLVTEDGEPIIATIYIKLK